MTSRSLTGLLVALVIGVLLWTQGVGTAPDTDRGRQGSHSARKRAPGHGATDRASGLRVVALADLPPEATRTLRLIDAGGPFPYDRDGVTFENREGILPDRPTGYYHEYTVPTPGSYDRGARRMVTGSQDEYYWTEDHYASFERIAR